MGLKDSHRLWRRAAAGLAVAGSLVCAAPALAVVRYASPAGVGTACTADAPCTFNQAVTGTADGMEIVVGSGTYNEAAELDVQNSVIVHGVSGQPRPLIQFGCGACSGLIFVGNNPAVSGLNVAGATSLTFALAYGGSADDMVVTGPSVACFLRNAIIRDSVCASTNGTGLETQANLGTTTMTVRNVTALGGGGDGMSFDASSGHSMTAAVVNSIARGVSGDIRAYTDSSGGVSSTVNVSYSSYGVPVRTGTGTAVNDGGHNQAAAPVFVNATSGDYHEAFGSPTIDAGVSDPANGAFDPDGTPRSLGAAPDIGAFEFAPPPVVTTGAASAIGPESATLSGTVNPNGTSATDGFDIGIAPGALNTSVAAPAAGAGTVAVPVSATATGLMPATTYYFRAHATNTGGTTNDAAVQSFTTAAAAPVVVTTISAGYDLFQTDPGATQLTFSEETTLPAGFFGGGSRPFTGRVNFGGVPLQTFMGHNTGDADTIVQHGAAALPMGGSVTAPIQMVALSLQGMQPITVTYNARHRTEKWDVRAGLSPTAPSRGTITINSDGTFSSTLVVVAQLTFTRVSTGPPRRPQTLTLDLAPLMASPTIAADLTFRSSGVPWSPGCELPALSVPGLNDGFCPGLNRFKDKIANVEQARKARHTVRPAQQRLEHFKCYSVAQRGFKGLDVTLADQFGTGSARVVKPFDLCAPAQKNDEPFLDTTGHLECYAIREAGFRRRHVAIRNQFGPDLLTVSRPSSLCVPSLKTIGKTPAPPLTALGSFPAKSQLTEHFECYDLASPPRASLRIVRLRDQFGRERVKVMRPLTLCAPVSKNGATVQHTVDHLVCYEIKDTPPVRPRRLKVQVVNQFGPADVTVLTPHTLCVPSLKLLLD